jgi:hypothetical protein
MAEGYALARKFGVGRGHCPGVMALRPSQQASRPPLPPSTLPAGPQIKTFFSYMLNEVH